MRILYGIVDAGAGHREGAKAIIASSDVGEHRIEDISAHALFPLSQLSSIYSTALRYAPRLYGAAWHATNGERRFRGIVGFSAGLYRKRMADLLRSFKPDVIVSIHPLLNLASVLARKDAHMEHVPIITVITDLGSIHTGWITPEVDAIVVPTTDVYKHARDRGITDEKIHLLGHPIHQKFEEITTSKEELCKQLNLPADKPIVLLMAGGEGGGKLSSIATALAKSKQNIHLVVCTGRNRAAKELLQALDPAPPTSMTVFGFSDKIPELIGSSNVVVTKAGPAAIREVCAVGKGLVIFDYVPGQEFGNISYVEKHKIGSIALTEPEVLSEVEHLLQNEKFLTEMCERQRSLVRRGSSRRIADLISNTSLKTVRRTRSLPNMKISSKTQVPPKNSMPGAWPENDQPRSR